MLFMLFPSDGDGAARPTEEPQRLSGSALNKIIPLAAAKVSPEKWRRFRLSAKVSPQKWRKVRLSAKVPPEKWRRFRLCAKVPPQKWRRFRLSVDRSWDSGQG